MSASSERERMPQRQLGELMTELGLISEEQLATVLEVQQQSKRPLGQIIVELGFASGAAVAHALAMQSGGALRTEYGFALGIAPKDGDAEGDSDETNVGLPKLRLAPTAVAPAARPDLAPAEDTETEHSPAEDIEEDPAPLAALPAPDETEQLDETDEIEETDESEAGMEVEAPEAPVEDEQTAEAESDEALDEVDEVDEVEANPEMPVVAETHALELDSCTARSPASKPNSPRHGPRPWPSRRACRTKQRRSRPPSRRPGPGSSRN